MTPPSLALSRENPFWAMLRLQKGIPTRDQLEPSVPWPSSGYLSYVLIKQLFYEESNTMYRLITPVVWISTTASLTFCITSLQKSLVRNINAVKGICKFTFEHNNIYKGLETQLSTLLNKTDRRDPKCVIFQWVFESPFSRMSIM